MTYPLWSITVTEDPSQPKAIGAWIVVLYRQEQKYARKKQACRGQGTTLSIALTALAHGAQRAGPGTAPPP